MHAVKQLCQDKLVVLTVANDEDRHIRIAPEDCHVVVDRHDVVLKRVYSTLTAARGTTLLA